MQCLSGKSEVQLERIAALLLERDQPAFSLSSSNQRLREVKQMFRSIKVGKITFVATVDHQALETGIFKAENESLKNSWLIRMLDTRFLTRAKKEVMFLRGSTCRMSECIVEFQSRFLFASLAISSELCPFAFESVRKQRW